MGHISVRSPSYDQVQDKLNDWLVEILHIGLTGQYACPQARGDNCRRAEAKEFATIKRA
jgi:hypothetical protein